MVPSQSAAFVIETIDSYLLETPKLIEMAWTAFSETDNLTLRRIVHTLSSSSALLGATHLADCCEALEHLLVEKAEAAPSATLQAKIVQIESAYQLTQAALQQERQNYRETSI
jgi:HPt (histidine-containing phosphotransfer) domain-containing protein